MKYQMHVMKGRKETAHVVTIDGRATVEDLMVLAQTRMGNVARAVHHVKILTDDSGMKMANETPAPGAAEADDLLS